MIDLKKQTNPSSVSSVKSSSDGVTSMPDSAPSSEEIRQRAYELYESRGREAGYEKQDWFRAEQEIVLALSLGPKCEAA
jgi:hypothetical protein